MTVGSVYKFDAGPGSTDATGKPRNALMNQRQVVQVLLLPMSGCSQTARVSSLPAVRMLIAQMHGLRTFIGAKGMQQENRSSRPVPVTRLCSGRSCAPLRGSRASSSSKNSGSGSARNSRTSGEIRLPDLSALCHSECESGRHHLVRFHMERT